MTNQEEQLQVQLAGCLTAAEGGTKNPALPGDYGWSIAYEQTLQLRLRYEKILNGVKEALNELGVPQPGYPAPVANAVEALRKSIDPNIHS